MLSFMPFFAGVRSCPAENLVYKGALYAAALFVHNYEFKPCEGAQLPLTTVKIGYHHFHDGVFVKKW